MNTSVPKTHIYNRLYEWYESSRRNLPWRETEDAYAIWLSEIILQQTRVAQGIDYYRRFIDRWPDVTALAKAEEGQVLREWQGLGYYSRARNLHRAAQMIVANGWEPFPTHFEAIRSLPGIGDYTAGAICSFAYNQPYPAMDGNVYRVVARLMDIDTPFDTTEGKKLFRQQIDLLMDKSHPRLFNSAIMEFGALYCTPVLSDGCDTCPLQDCCASHAHGTAHLLPVRKPRPKIHDRYLTYHIYMERLTFSDQVSEIRTLIRRREEKDIWYHLYEFPCQEQDSPSTEGKPFFTCTHILSHQRIHARFIVHPVDTLPRIPGTRAIGWDKLNEFALSRLTLRAIDTLLHTR